MKLDQILKAKYAGDLFSNDLNKIKVEYKALSKQWHPDLNNNSKEANDAMAKINDLYAKGIELLEKNKWEKTNYVMLVTTDKRIFEINYKRMFNFELGQFYVCDKSVIYVIDKTYTALYNNYKMVVSNLQYPNSKMKEEFERLIPKIVLEFQTDTQLVMKIEKPDNVFSMIDIHSFYKGEIPDKHVAWIVNRLYNLVCFLDYNKLSFNALTIENLFVNPEFHGIFLLNGWWFATKLGVPLTNIPKKVFNLMPYEAKSKGIADRRIDLETVRLVARQLLGDEYGVKILNSKEIPQPMKDWVLDKSGKSALGEYQKWNEMLDKAYGKRIFIKMNINKNNLYETKE